MATEGPGIVSAAERQVVKSPRSAGIAGLLFAITFSLSVTILYLSVTGSGRDSGAWLAERAGWVSFAVGLMPFAGIFFLWFIGVVRARLGRFEDQLFSTVFLGSGLVFLALVFVAAAIAGAIVAGYNRDPTGYPDSSAYYFARDIISQLFGVYALRMAALFILSQAALWLRTKVMPRWMALLTFAVGLLLLFGFSQSFWVVLVFPAWVFLVSAFILVVSFLRRKEEAASVPTQDEAERTPAG